MLRRSILGLSSRSKRLATQFSAPLQQRSFSLQRKEFPNTSRGNGPPKPPPADKPEEAKGSFQKPVIIGGLVVGAFLAAYQAGYLDPYLGEGQKKYGESTKFDVTTDKVKGGNHLGERMASSNFHDPYKSSPSLEQKVETQTEVSSPGASDEMQGKGEVQDKSDGMPQESTVPSSKPDETLDETSIHAEEKSLPRYLDNNTDIKSTKSETPSEISNDIGSLKSKDVAEPTENVAVDAQSTSAHEDSDSKSVPSEHHIIEQAPKDTVNQDAERPTSLLEEYHLSGGNKISSNWEQSSKKNEALVSAIEELNDGYMTKDGKLVLDFLAAIHAAEERQAELDARVFAEEIRALKERYENELRDLRARELMRIEEAAILDKELKRERAKAAAAIKSIQEKMEEKLRTELEQKETELQTTSEKIQELAKAELAAAIANEKAAQIEKMAEADLNIKALRMAFYARSEEARKSHYVHKLALGALALEDSLSKGLPIQKEIDALQTYLQGIEKDSILDLVLSSLPEETQYHGTDTLLQLCQKFITLKGTLRHFSLIPPSGGGILAHSVAHIASWLKVKEVDQSGDGIESVLKRVDNYLAEGKLAEAAAALEEGVRGSQAEEVVSDWVRRARNRAITEQALTLLQSYATCVSLT